MSASVTRFLLNLSVTVALLVLKVLAVDGQPCNLPRLTMGSPKSQRIHLLLTEQRTCEKDEIVRSWVLCQ